MFVKIYTDGAARGNPDGPGGYGCVLHYTDAKENYMKNGYQKDMCGPQTTGWN